LEDKEIQDQSSYRDVYAFRIRGINRVSRQASQLERRRSAM